MCDAHRVAHYWMVRTGIAMRDNAGVLWDEPDIIDSLDLTTITGRHYLSK